MNNRFSLPDFLKLLEVENIAFDQPLSLLNSYNGENYGADSFKSYSRNLDIRNIILKNLQNLLLDVRIGSKAKILITECIYRLSCLKSNHVITEKNDKIHSTQIIREFYRAIRDGDSSKVTALCLNPDIYSELIKKDCNERILGLVKIQSPSMKLNILKSVFKKFILRTTQSTTEQYSLFTMSKYFCDATEYFINTEVDLFLQLENPSRHIRQYLKYKIANNELSSSINRILETQNSALISYIPQEYLNWSNQNPNDTSNAVDLQFTEGDIATWLEKTWYDELMQTNNSDNNNSQESNYIIEIQDPSSQNPNIQLTEEGFVARVEIDSMTEVMQSNTKEELELPAIISQLLPLQNSFITAYLQNYYLTQPNSSTTTDTVDTLDFISTSEPNNDLEVIWDGMKTSGNESQPSARAPAQLLQCHEKGETEFKYNPNNNYSLQQNPYFPLTAEEITVLFQMDSTGKELQTITSSQSEEELATFLLQENSNQENSNLEVPDQVLEEMSRWLQQDNSQANSGEKIRSSYYMSGITQFLPPSPSSTILDEFCKYDDEDNFPPPKI